MKTLAAIKRRMLPGARLLCVENTYRPALNGSLRTVVKSGPGAWKFTVDGDDKVSVGFWPKASEVKIIDADTFSLGFEMASKAQRVTLRFVAEGIAAPPKPAKAPVAAGAPLVFVDGRQAFNVVKAKAIKGHKDWLLWQMKDGTHRAARMPDADALESAMTDNAVDRATVIMVARDSGMLMSPKGVWKTWAANMKSGNWSE